MLAKEVVSAVVPSGDIVFVEAVWDALLRSTYKHVAIRCVCGVRVTSLCILGDLVFFFQSLLSVSFPEVPSRNWFTSYRLNRRWQFDDRRPMV